MCLLPAVTNITVGENLTKNNADIFALAKAMKRNKQIAQTFTENGLVYVKLEKGRTVQAILIRSKRQLEQLVGVHNEMETSAIGDLNSNIPTPPQSIQQPQQYQQHQQQQQVGGKQQSVSTAQSSTEANSTTETVFTQNNQTGL